MTEPDVKKCAACLNDLPASAFYANGQRNGRTYLKSHCRACSKERSRESRASLSGAQKAKRATATAKWKKRNPKKVKEMQKRYFSTDKGIDAAKRRNHRMIAEMSTSYIRSVMGFRKGNAYLDLLIPAKREQMRLKRAVLNGELHRDR